VILPQHGNALILADGNFTPVVFGFTGEDFKKRGFSRAVCANNTVAVAGREFEVDIFEEGALSKCMG
jgi:hypothetical protein